MDDKSTFCKHKSDTLLQLFWNCETIKLFWSQLHLYINTECNLSLPEFKLGDIMFGSMSLDKALSMILLQAKYFLYNNKMNEKTHLLSNSKID